MSVEENKALIQRYFELMNAKDVEAAKECYSPDAIFVYNIPPGKIAAREHFRLVLTRMIEALPDYQYQIEDVFGEGDKVAVRYIFSGTHQGEFRGFAPTGEVLTTQGIAIYQVVDGKILESRAYSNAVEMLTQIRDLSVPS